MIRRASWVVLLSSLLALPGAAAFAAPPSGNPRAEARAQAKVQVKKGQLDYKLARFEEALQDYTNAYELLPVPALLFNLGQCHRNLKNYERAIFFFEGFLREQTKISQDQRVLTEALIAECQGALDRENADAAAAAARFAAPALGGATATPPTGLRTAALRSGGAPSAPGASLQLAAAAHADRTGDGGDAQAHSTPLTHRWWFWTAIAGVLAAGAAAYYVSGDPRLVAPTGTVGTVNGR